MATTHRVGETPIISGSEVAEVVAAIRDDAIAQAQTKLAAIQRDLNLGTLLHRSNFFDYFKHALASGVADALAANDENVVEVYVCDPSVNPDCEMGADMPLDATVHLIVVVTKPSAALEALIASLDRALVKSLKELPSATFANREFVLDVNVVSEDDVRRGVGYARMLTSVYAPPLKVWAR